MRFSRTLLVRSRPCPRRSSGTSAMPSRPVSACARAADRRRLAPQLDRARRPCRRRTAPGTARAGRGPAGRRRRAPRLRAGRSSTPAEPVPLRESATLSATRSVAVERALGIEPVEVAADHLGDDLVVVDRCRSSWAATVAPLRKMVMRSAICAHLGHAVRDEDDEPALRGEARARAEQPLGLARRAAPRSPRRGSGCAGSLASALAISTICRSASVSRRTSWSGRSRGKA